MAIVENPMSWVQSALPQGSHFSLVFSHRSIARPSEGVVVEGFTAQPKWVFCVIAAGRCYVITFHLSGAAITDNQDSKAMLRSEQEAHSGGPFVFMTAPQPSQFDSSDLLGGVHIHVVASEELLAV